MKVTKSELIEMLLPTIEKIVDQRVKYQLSLTEIKTGKSTPTRSSLMETIDQEDSLPVKKQVQTRTPIKENVAVKEAIRKSPFGSLLQDSFNELQQERSKQFQTEQRLNDPNTELSAEEMLAPLSEEDEINPDFRIDTSKIPTGALDFLTKDYKKVVTAESFTKKGNSPL